VGVSKEETTKEENGRAQIEERVSEETHNSQMSDSRTKRRKRGAGEVWAKKSERASRLGERDEQDGD
jgi:hypothetical protein